VASLKQYYHTLYYFSKAVFIFKRLKTYLKNEFIKDLDFPSSLKDDYFYHSSYYNRTKQYMHANHFFGELLCLLRARPLSVTERMRFANLSSCAPIFDDFFEKESHLPHILSLLQNPVLAHVQTKEEELAVHFLNNILSSSIDREAFIHAALQLFQAQVKSKTQKNITLSNEELLDISIKKGGFSGLMYGHLLSNDKNEDFLKMAYLLGALGQLMDDVFDIYDDAQEGIRTFANQCDSVAEIRMILQKHQAEILLQIEKLKSLDFKTHGFLQVLKIFQSTIEIALLQYEKGVEKYHTKPQQCLQDKRAVWLVDMERPHNIWRLFLLAANQL
jgi:hypothetical protein